MNRLNFPLQQNRLRVMSGATGGIDGAPSKEDGFKLFYRTFENHHSQCNQYSKGILMGKGDRRSLRGKLFRGSYGKKRPRKKAKKTAPKANA
jgi:30S ribosomal protein S31